MPRHLLIALTAILFAACGQDSATDPSAPEAPADEAAPGALPTGRIAAPEGAEVYFANLEDGDTVSNPFTIRFGLRGMDVIPAGEHRAHSGHHHLLIDVDDFDPNLPLPADEQHIHYGAGQTETEIDLPPGSYTLQLVLGDWKHQPHDPIVASERITITVE